MPYKNKLREKMRRGEAVVGAFYNFPSAIAVEMLGTVGLDFIILDCEHSTITPETAENIYRAAQLAGISTITRVGENIQQHILKYLDAGTDGVQVPLVNTAAEAQMVADAVKYPPIGKRGMAGPRLAGFGRIPLAEFVAQWNQEGIVCVQIETREGIKNFPEIVKNPNVDIVFFGPTDLSVSLGHPGETTHPEVVSVISDLGKQTIAAGKVAGTIMADSAGYKRYRDLGFLYACAAVGGFMTRGARLHLEECAQYERGRRR
ncbi:MAG: 2-dehydro-3-deoxyglucarate aldolase [Chloroflexi bacterium]|nr:2-dehydro-3-deoxyglucarate aldolase [Chloroflexota bacterium]